MEKQNVDLERFELKVCFNLIRIDQHYNTAKTSEGRFAGIYFMSAECLR